MGSHILPSLKEFHPQNSYLYSLTFRDNSFFSIFLFFSKILTKVEILYLELDLFAGVTIKSLLSLLELIRRFTTKCYLDIAKNFSKIFISYKGYSNRVLGFNSSEVNNLAIRYTFSRSFFTYTCFGEILRHSKIYFQTNW